MKLSIVIPTIGRPSLVETLASIEVPCDVVVVGDGSQPLAAAISQPVARYVEAPKGGIVGNRQRNWVLDNVPLLGDFVAWIDDDDVYVPGAVPLICEILSANPGRPHMFRICINCGIVVWVHTTVMKANVGGHCFIAPNDKRLGRWGESYEGDFDFIESTLANYKENDLIWRPEIIVIQRPISESLGGIGNPVPSTCSLMDTL